MRAMSLRRRSCHTAFDMTTRDPTISLVRHGLAFVCLTAGALACSGDRRPEVPATPGDAAISTADEVATPVVSHFQAPLSYDFTPILAVVERAVPKTFGSLDSVRQVGDDNRKHYAFEATRDTFTTYIRG